VSEHDADVWPLIAWALRLPDAPSSPRVGRDGSRIVLVAMCHAGEWVGDRFLVAERGLTDWCPPEYDRRLVREAIGLLVRSGHLRRDGSAGERYEVVIPPAITPNG
jgi:hypothetical protein